MTQQVVMAGKSSDRDKDRCCEYVDVLWKLSSLKYNHEIKRVRRGSRCKSSNRRAWNGVVGWKGGEALIYNVLACLAWLGSDKAENSQKVNTDGGLDPPALAGTQFPPHP